MDGTFVIKIVCYILYYIFIILDIYNIIIIENYLHYVIIRELKSWCSSSEVIESLVNDLDCVSRKVLYPELLVFAYAVFNSEHITLPVRIICIALS